MTFSKIFWAYPSNPYQVRDSINEAATRLRGASYKFDVVTWEQMDSPGRFLVDGILEKIDNADLFIADITDLNFNVVFEVGYALGRCKRPFITLNHSLSPPLKLLSQLGIYDTLGYYSYANSTDLVNAISAISDITPITFSNYQIDRSAPLYIMDTLHKTDASIRIKSKVKKSRIKFRSYDPSEQPRMSTLEGYRNVKQSIAVVVHLLSPRSTDFFLNNLRGAFLAGLAYGMDKGILILQDGDEPVPLDYRDLVSVYKHPRDVDRFINDLVPRVVQGLQSVTGQIVGTTENFLARMDLGSSAAENEMTSLSNYYLQTDEFNKAISGLVRIVVGRKGSGKTALFFQARDRIREDKKNIVLDLKPEGHQLKRFKEVLYLLGDAVQEHVVSAFWEYVLLLEICNKLLQKDQQTHTRDHTLFEPYKRLASLYSHDDLVEEADFSERMLEIIERIKRDFDNKYGLYPQYLSVAQVNELIYKHDIPKLREELVAYLRRKSAVWILFDNIDKGWPTRGISEADITILRALLDSTRKIERFFSKNNIDFVSIVFIRNDVYELLVDETPDRGKESKVSLDWTDSDGLRELLRRRIAYNGITDASSFLTGWRTIFVSHIDGEESSEYLLERSLMRPRNFLNLVNYCKSNAVNLQHHKVDEDDIRKAYSMYSYDIGNEIGLEIRDVFPEADDILYYFIGAPDCLTLLDVKQYLKQSPVSEANFDKLIEILLWFGFLGVKRDDGADGEVIYIYDVYYDMKKLKKLAADLKLDKLEFTIHRAFWPFLEIATE
jgi:Cdc6-like AAA superfamily ATPase